MSKHNVLLWILVTCVGLAVPNTLQAQQTLGVSLPATLAASWSDTSSVDTFVTPFVATQSGSITTWKAQFYPSVIFPTGCPQPVGMQLKVLRPAVGTSFTVAGAGNVFNPLALLEAQLGITTCPLSGMSNFVQDTASTVLQFIEPVPLQVLAGDVIGLTVTSGPSVGAYALEFTGSASYTTVLQGQSAAQGTTVNTSGGLVQSGYENEIQVQVSMPTPVLTFLGTSLSSSGTQTYYDLSVSNWQLYSADLFAPTTPPVPCSDFGPTTTRINVDLYDATSNNLMVVFCGLTSPYGLTQLFFPVVPDGTPPSSVYILTTDTLTNTTVQSNTLTIAGATPNGYSPIAESLSASGGTNPYQFTSNNVINAFSYKVTYPALSGSPSNVDLVLQPILIAQTDLDALLAGSGFAGAQLVVYDDTGGDGVLFRATCQDHSTNQPVTCPDTTGVNTFYTSWNIPSGGSSPTNLAFLKAPVGTKGPGWQNIFSSYSETRTDPTGTGRSKPSFSDFVFVQTVTGTAPTITINTPVDGAVYTLNQTVDADYSCSGTYVSCLGNVLSGRAIDTTSLGSKTFTVNAIVNSGPAAAQTVNYTVASGPLASVSPSSINFDTVYLGTITVKSVTVTNWGVAPMTIADPLISILSGGNSNEFVALNLCPKLLAVGASCKINIAFVAGPFYNPQTARLKIMDNAPGSPQTVALTATVINPQAWLNPWSLRFGTQTGSTTSAAKVVTLKNAGATALNINGIAIAGADPLDFAQTNNCPLSPASLAPAASCTISVTFTPTAKGPRSGSVVITDNALFSPQIAWLSGMGN